jgi:hypothetical protein
MHPQHSTISTNRLWWGALAWCIAAHLAAMATAEHPALAATTPDARVVGVSDASPADCCGQSWRAGRLVCETGVRLERCKVLRPVWETEYREEPYLVRRPIFETSMRQQEFTVYQPVTTFVEQSVDQGQWVEHVVQGPSRQVTKLKWVPQGWNVDPKTGLQYWRPGALRPVRVERPGRVRTFRVWQSNIVTTPVPTTNLVPRVQTRQVPVQTVRYVQERRVRKVPVKVRRMVEQEIVQRVPVLTRPAVVGVPACPPLYGSRTRSIEAAPSLSQPATEQPRLNPTEGVPQEN